MTRKNKNRFFKDSCTFVFNIIKECKIKTIIITTFIVIAFLTGIIVAAKTHNNYNIFDNFGVVDISSNEVSSSTFFTRLFSMLFIFLILFGCSYNKYLFPMGFIFLIYRAYLLGLNICLMIVFYGFSGVVVSIIVAFPCQLAVLATLAIFFILMSKTFCDNNRFERCKVPKQKTKIALYSVIILLLLCILESILLALFSAKIILVI